MTGLLSHHQALGPKPIHTTFVVEILRNPKIALNYWLVGGRVLRRGVGAAKLFPLLSVFRLRNKSMLIKAMVTCYAFIIWSYTILQTEGYNALPISTLIFCTPSSRACPCSYAGEDPCTIRAL